MGPNTYSQGIWKTRVSFLRQANEQNWFGFFSVLAGETKSITALFMSMLGLESLRDTVSISECSFFVVGIIEAGFPFFYTLKQSYWIYPPTQ